MGAGEATPPSLTGCCTLQKEVAKMYSSFQVMYTVGYCLSLGALLLALAILLGLRYEPRPAQDGGRAVKAVGGQAGTDSLFPQQAALHPKLHPCEPVRVLRAEGLLRAGH